MSIIEIKQCLLEHIYTKAVTIALYITVQKLLHKQQGKWPEMNRTINMCHLVH